MTLTSIAGQDAPAELRPVRHVVLYGGERRGPSEREQDGGHAEEERLEGGRRVRGVVHRVAVVDAQMDDDAQPGKHGGNERRHADKPDGDGHRPAVNRASLGRGGC